MGMRESLEQRILYAIAVVNGAIGLTMVAAPGFFFEEVGPFPPRNDHYLRDTATYYLAAALATTVAARRATWRLPVLVLLAVQYALHTVNHVIDVSDAEPVGTGVFNIVTLAAGTAVLVALALRVSGRQRET